MAWTLTDGGDHEGNAWIIDSNTTIDGVHYNITSFKIDSGVTVTQDGMGDAETEPEPLTIQADSIEIVGTLTGNGKGHWGGNYPSPDHLSGYGPGGSPGALSNEKGTGGGGYGGAGGTGGSSSGSDGAGGSTYGSSTSVDCRYGSGSGYADTTRGAKGGGAVKLIAVTIIISGTVTVNGANGTGTSNDGAGGGSGGGIAIIGNDVDLTNGTVTANGGNGYNSSDHDGGGGGGGRIKVHYSASYTTIGSTITASGGSDNGGYGTNGSAGTTTNQKIGRCDSTDAYGWKQTFNTGYRIAISEVTVYVETVNTGGDFTLTVYDDENKGTTYESDTVTISGTGEKVFQFTNYQILEDGTSYYFEIIPTSTGDIELAVDVDYENDLNEYFWAEQEEVIGMQPYLKLDGFSHMVNPKIYNTADTDTVLSVASVLLNGAAQAINPDGTGTYNYQDTFTTEKYLADCAAVSGDTYQSTTDDLDIADDGYIYWLFDTLYPITGTPVLTATIDITAGTPTIQVALDNNGSPGTWYDIDTAIVDNVETAYNLVSGSDVKFANQTKIWVRIDCSDAGTVTCTVTSIELDVHIITIDAQMPVIHTGGANTFQCDQDSVSSPSCTVALVYDDRKWA